MWARKAMASGKPRQCTEKQRPPFGDKSLYSQSYGFSSSHVWMWELDHNESESEVAQSCPTLCDPMDCSLPGSSIHGIFQARVLEWVAISFSRGSSQPRDQIWVSRTAGRRFTIWATTEDKNNFIWWSIFNTASDFEIRFIYLKISHGYVFLL